MNNYSNISKFDRCNLNGLTTNVSRIHNSNNDGHRRRSSRHIVKKIVYYEIVDYCGRQSKREVESRTHRHSRQSDRSRHNNTKTSDMRTNNHVRTHGYRRRNNNHKNINFNRSENNIVQ